MQITLDLTIIPLHELGITQVHQRLGVNLMSNPKTEISKGLDIHKQSPSLLFQFILNEFLDTFNESKKIEKLYRAIENSVIKNRLFGQINDYLNELLHALTVLLGSTLVSEEPVTWRKELGSLSKLHEYCYLFSNTHNFNERFAENLNACISQAYHGCLQSREALTSMVLHQNRGYQADDSGEIPNYAHLYKLLDQLLDSLQRASRIILQLILCCKDDENILFFILKNNMRFLNVYPAFSLEKLFSRIFPRGLKEAKSFLINRYAERGFKDLIEEISSFSHLTHERDD